MIAPLAVLLVLGSAVSHKIDIIKPHYDIDKANTYFEDFIRVYNKTYSTEEEKTIRLNIFKDNLIQLNELNNKHELTVHAVNFFADFNHEEFMEYSTGYNANDEGRSGHQMCTEINTWQLNPAPESFDWRSRNVVTPVKQQQKCASCWAFSLTANVESQYALKYNMQVDLSEQQLVDCLPEADCKIGASPYSGAGLLIEEGGQMDEAYYAYESAKLQCRFNPSSIRVQVNSCYYTFTDDEEMIKKLLYNYGPLTFGLHSKSIMTYHGSILEECASGEPNHAVLLVGYGTEYGFPYWIVKNSWGSWWGEQGYFRIPRGVNACNMVKQGFIVTSVS